MRTKAFIFIFSSLLSAEVFATQDCAEALSFLSGTWRLNKEDNAAPLSLKIKKTDEGPMVQLNYTDQKYQFLIREGAQGLETTKVDPDANLRQIGQMDRKVEIISNKKYYKLVIRTLTAPERADGKAPLIGETLEFFVNKKNRSILGLRWKEDRPSLEGIQSNWQFGEYRK